ncbi:MAG: GntR family transcriptional regulator [Sphingomonas sp.]
MEDESAGAATKIYLGVMQDLEDRTLVAGQRLVETELAERFGVGRNAVREAMQRLAARGIIDLNRHRSAAIRKIDLAETLEVLDVASALMALTARYAAQRFDPERHADLLAEALERLSDPAALDEPGRFSRARRGFYRSLLAIGGNRELQRIFPAVGMHIIYSQFQSSRLQGVRLADYQRIASAVSAGDVRAAETASRDHVDRVRDIIVELSSA